LSDGENVPTMNDTLTWFLFFFLSDARLIYAQTRWAHQQQQGEKDATVLLMKPLL
jgi:hypothetical protein